MKSDVKLFQYQIIQVICEPAQNLPSIACGHALIGDGESVASGAHVLDMCAAPGGKTTHLAAKLAAASAQAKVVAFDKSKNKVGFHAIIPLLYNPLWNSLQVAQIESNSERQGLAEYVVAHVQDATKSVATGGCLDDADNLAPPFPEGSFTRIMLDAPCSALGELSGIDS